MVWQKQIKVAMVFKSVVQVYKPATLLQKDFNTGVFLRILQRLTSANCCFCKLLAVITYQKNIQ